MKGPLFTCKLLSSSLLGGSNDDDLQGEVAGHNPKGFTRSVGREPHGLDRS